MAPIRFSVEQADPLPLCEQPKDILSPFELICWAITGVALIQILLFYMFLALRHGERRTIEVEEIWTSTEDAGDAVPSYELPPGHFVLAEIEDEQDLPPSYDDVVATTRA